jgi:hypothetical protein
MNASLANDPTVIVEQLDERGNRYLVPVGREFRRMSYDELRRLVKRTAKAEVKNTLARHAAKPESERIHGTEHRTSRFEIIHQGVVVGRFVAVGFPFRDES